ncbi:glycosyltransferase [Lyngbya aestuarii]|uniref:glycosyltransferase n=1 Tax=Lyngbya aestuarii TaxID=118322 RepID=UPI00403D6AF5
MTLELIEKKLGSNLAQKTAPKQKGMLLVLPVPFRLKGKQILCESQACNGLEKWADNFESLVVAAPVIPESLAQQSTTMTWCSTETITNIERIQLVPLPWAYSPGKFISCYASARASLAELIARCRYLQFAIGGLWGDWAAIAALEARKQGRKYAVHTDRVEHKVILQSTRKAPLKTRAKAIIEASLMAFYHKLIIKSCTLGLWHGNDCYSAYSPFCQNNYSIHNIHTKPSDCIGELELSEKIQRATSDPVIRICYAGRIEEMKAPLDWVRAIGKARDLGVKLQATWLGDGSLSEKMKALITSLDLDGYIELSGFQSDRGKLLKKIRESHIMLFTHVTPESPRCLIESLVCGTPIVGYRTEYPEELLKGFGAGMLAPMRDWQKLGELLANLSQDRQGLSQMIREAAINGQRFNDQAVFRERSELIKRHLS